MKYTTKARFVIILVSAGLAVGMVVKAGVENYDKGDVQMEGSELTYRQSSYFQFVWAAGIAIFAAVLQMTHGRALLRTAKEIDRLKSESGL